MKSQTAKTLKNDEAHRTQYKDLTENMHTALPNANFITFTGTPLLGSKRLTNQWFGDYVSEYNFAQSVEYGSTVPLFYSRRVPEVGLTNNFLDDDIAHHFPRRGFLGKGMVVSVDKFTAVKMYDKVQHYWEEEKKQLIKDRNSAATKDIEYLLELIGQSIDEADEFLSELDIRLDEINKLPEDLEKLEALRNALEIIYQKDEGKEKFRVITNTMLVEVKTKISVLKLKALPKKRKF